jgi:hypothetical protein
MPIPRAINDYNFHMGGVDRANQLRESYETHQKMLRSWWPIFFWLLDVAIINAYLIGNITRQSQRIKTITHLEFRKDLYKELFQLGLQETVAGKRKRDLEKIGQPETGELHEAIRIPHQKRCFWCKQKTTFSCRVCGVPLCRKDIRSCWLDHHVAVAQANEN